MSTIISKKYYHLVEYYETDAMRIVGHSAYIHWMEEARHQFFIDAGIDLYELETKYGIMIPILHMDVDYKGMCRFGETIGIQIKPTRFNGVYLDFVYRMTGSNGGLRIIANSREGFINKDYKPIILQKACPEAYDKLKGCIEDE